MRNKKHQETQFTSVAHDPMDTRHHGSISIPIYQTSLFAFDNHDDFDQAMVNVLDNIVYSRGNNPTVVYLEQKLAELEEGELAKCFASGMAAISSAIMSVIRSGDHIICTHQVMDLPENIIGSYLERFGIETTFVDGTSMEEWKAAIRPNTKLIYLESPTSAYFQLQDLQALVELARSIGAITICDGSWGDSLQSEAFKTGCRYGSSFYN